MEGRKGRLECDEKKRHRKTAKQRVARKNEGKKK